MKLILNNEQLLEFVPNSIAAVKGETSLFEKVEVHLQSAERWLAQTFTGEELLETPSALDPQLLSALRCIVATEALDKAIPAMDLVFTPNGFAVTQTANLTPASKQRVDRLIGDMREIRDNAIESALTLLPANEAWLQTEQARYFADTLFPNIDLPSLCGVNTGRWDKYTELRYQALSIEMTLAEEYFSQELLAELRRQLIRNSLSREQQRVTDAVRAQVVDVLQDRPINSNRMRDVVNFIRYNPEIFPQWHSSATAKLFSPPKFENKKSASGYFF